MSRGNLKDHLTDYYTAGSIKPQTAKRLTALAQVDINGGAESSPRSPVERWSRVMYAAAACLAIALMGIGYWVFPGGEEQGSLADSQPAGLSDRTAEVVSSRSDALPGLVAVKFHADWCGRSPVVAPIFTELAEKYGNRPVLFVTFDITNETTQQQARYLASSLGIDFVYERPRESGMILLVDRVSKETLATLRETRQQPQMETALALALPRKP